MLFRKLKLPYMGYDRPYLFFSFCYEDTARAREIIIEFQRQGYLCFFDFRSSLLPDEYPEILEKRLRSASAVVCLLSRASQYNSRCRFEMDYARDYGKEIIPVMLEDSVAFPELSLSLSDSRSFLLRPGEKKKGLQNLVRSITREVHLPKSPKDRPKPREDIFSFGDENPWEFGTDDSSWDDDSSAFDSAEDSPGDDGKDGMHGTLLDGNTGSFGIAEDSPGDDEAEGVKPGTEDRKEEEKKKETDKVSFSVLSPRAVRPDSYGMIDLYMYTGEQREVVDRAIRESSGLVSETSKSGFSVRRETSVTARLESDDVEIRDPLETQVWNGESLHFDFRFFVPETYSRSQVAFTCYIECNGIPFTRLNFITTVSRKPEPDTLPAKVTRSDFRKAFISYSRKDEQRMLARVLGIQDLVPEMKFWLDQQSMDAGDLWREEIRKAINISDILLLFWSVPASQSAEVEKEWRYGLEQRGLSFISPVPLDPPAECPPPEALNSLNFTVRAFSRNEITEKLSFFSSNIQVL